MIVHTATNKCLVEQDGFEHNVQFVRSSGSVTGKLAAGKRGVGYVAKKSLPIIARQALDQGMQR